MINATRWLGSTCHFLTQPRITLAMLRSSSWCRRSPYIVQRPQDSALLDANLLRPRPLVGGLGDYRTPIQYGPRQRHLLKALGAVHPCHEGRRQQPHQQVIQLAQFQLGEHNHGPADHPPGVGGGPVHGDFRGCHIAIQTSVVLCLILNRKQSSLKPENPPKSLNTS